MNTTRRLLGTIGVTTALAITAVACGGDHGGSSSTTAAGSATTTASGGTDLGGLNASLNGSGSTFQQTYQQVSIVGFTEEASGVTINYGGGGSGKGRTDLKNKVTDFAGSDSAYADADKPAEPVLYFPILLGPITVSYNLSGVDNLQLSADTIAKIFQLQITSWDDAAIKADNPDAELPAQPITVAVRSDGSGTSDNFTKYLAAAAPGVFTIKPGSQPEWPTGASVQAGNGNQGVAQIVKGTDGAIGYVDLSDAKGAGLAYASIKNQAGQYVEPTPESASAAADGIQVKPDLTFAAINAAGEAAYPITYQSWVIVYANQTDPAKGAALKAFVEYLITGGQASLAELDYAPLPTSLQEKAVAQLSQIVVP